jgi:hypothetical protein
VPLFPLVAVGPGADAGLVALGIGENPERAREGIADQPAASVGGGAHACLGLVVGHRDVGAGPAALRAWRVHLLESDSGELSVRIHDGVLGAAAARPVGVGHDRLPERAEGRYVQRVDVGLSRERQDATRWPLP